MLRGIDFAEVIVALKATDRSDVVLAALFVAAGYFTLTFYDLFALRTIGANHVPYRVAALAGFTSYSIGHNVGASVFTGGAVRYRVYSAWGLTAIDVAKICFIAGLTFWLGNATVLGLGIAYEPEAASAIDQLPPWFNRVIALVALGVLAGYVAWVWVKPRVIGRADWSVTLPGGPLTLLQIAIGIVDLAFCALAMYVLLPDEPHIDFIKLAVVFVSATLLGFASHSPGGLGVFDAAMLVALIEFDKEQLVAGLLLFRLLYYIVPFALSLLDPRRARIVAGRRVQAIAEHSDHGVRLAVRSTWRDAPRRAGRGRSTARRRATALLDAVVAGMPDAAIVLDREGRVVAFNAPARVIAPALARGAPASLALRVPEVVEAVREVAAGNEPRSVEFSQRVPVDRWFEAHVRAARRARRRRR